MFSRAITCLGLVVVLLLVVVPSRGDDGWSLTTADFKRQTVNLKAIDDKGVHVSGFGQAQSTAVPMERFLQLDRGGSSQVVRGTWILHLVSGDRIGGEPIAIADDNLGWNSPAAGKLDVPLKEVRGMARPQEVVQFEANRTEDAVFLTNGDNVKGIISGIQDGKLLLKQAGGDTLPVDLASARSVHLAAAGKPDNAGKRAFRVQLSDGSVITAPKIAFTGEQINLVLGSGNQRAIDVAQVVMIEQLNGPVSWLSARLPDQTVYQPMLDIAFPPQMDRNYRGERIKLAGREYARGIGVHAFCRLTWKLDGTFKAFRTQYAMNEDAFKGRVTVRILLDDKVVHEAVDFGAGKIAPIVVLELGSAKTITLEAHPGGDAKSSDPTTWNIDTQARLNWLEPALLREKPALEEPKPIVPAALKPVRPAEPQTQPSGRKPESPATGPATRSTRIKDAPASRATDAEPTPATRPTTRPAGVVE